MIGLILITVIAALAIGPYLYQNKKASIQLGFFPGIMIGSSFSKNEIETEDNGMITLGTLQFSLICLMTTFIWVIDKKEAS